MKKEINILEVASELAMSRLTLELEDIYVLSDNGDYILNDEAQDIFNEHYDYYENILNNLK